MQKRYLKIVGAIAAVIVVSGLITLKVLDNIQKYEEKEAIKKVQADDEEETTEDQTRKIGGVEYDVGLNDYSQ